MTSSLRAIKALLIKNNAQTGLGWSIFVVAAIFTLTLSDAVHPMPAPAWWVLLYGVVAMSVGGGVGTFSHDFKHDSIRFLEYLPVRRWQIWTANWLDGIFWTWSFVLAAFLIKALRWRAP